MSPRSEHYRWPTPTEVIDTDDDTRTYDVQDRCGCTDDLIHDWGHADGL